MKVDWFSRVLYDLWLVCIFGGESYRVCIVGCFFWIGVVFFVGVFGGDWMFDFEDWLDGSFVY